VFTEADCLWTLVRQYCRQHVSQQTYDWPSGWSHLRMFHWTADRWWRSAANYQGIVPVQCLVIVTVVWVSLVHSSLMSSIGHSVQR